MRQNSANLCLRWPVGNQLPGEIWQAICKEPKNPARIFLTHSLRIGPRLRRRCTHGFKRRNLTLFNQSMGARHRPNNVDFLILGLLQSRCFVSGRYSRSHATTSFMASDNDSRSPTGRLVNESYTDRTFQ